MRIGTPTVRDEDMPLLRGQGCYTADLPPAKDELAMALVRSPVAAGTLRGIETTDALAIPGVVAILTAADLVADGIGSLPPRITHPGPNGGPMSVPPSPLLATDRVFFVGQPVAVVLAQTQHAARDAAEAVFVDIEDAASVTDIDAALADGAPRVWAELPDNRLFVVDRGDAGAVDDALARAAHVIHRRLRVSRVTAAPLEPRAVCARYDPEAGRYHLDIGTQAPHRIALDLAPAFGVTPDRIHVMGRACGGSFGMKNTGTAEAALALWAARQSGRPVRWVSGRLEAFLGDPQGRDQRIDAWLALDEHGNFLAFRADIAAALGALIGPATPHSPVGNLGGLAGVYTTPAMHARVTGVFTNTQHTAPYRGAGRPEATYAIEAMIDAAAAELGLDRAELRRRNMIAPAQMPYRTPLTFTYDSGDFSGVLDRALVAADWVGFPARRAKARARGYLRGIGIACPIEIAGGPTPKPNPEFAGLEIAPDGTARMLLGSCDAGQGHMTSFRQILADRLGLAPEGVAVISGDTDVIARATGTFGSRTMVAAGTALWAVMDEIIQTLRDDAADILEAAPVDLEFTNAAYRVAGTDRAVPFAQVLARRAGPVAADNFTAADGPTFPNGCHICELEIDPDTGALAIVRYVVVDDVGTVINPMLVKGQIAGGVAQGIGQALGEYIAHDPHTGQLLTASFMDYALPRASDVPMVQVISHPVPTQTNPLGVKGVGESGTVGALSAVMSAVRDAIAPAGAGPIEMPATPARIWTALQRA